MSDRRLAWARSSSSPAGMSVDQSVTSRSRSSTVPTASAMSREATAAAKSASRSRTRSTSGEVLRRGRPAVATAPSSAAGAPAGADVPSAAGVPAVERRRHGREPLQSRGSGRSGTALAAREGRRTARGAHGHDAPTLHRCRTGVEIEDAGRVLVDSEHERSLGQVPLHHRRAAARPGSRNGCRGSHPRCCRSGE